MLTLIDSFGVLDNVTTAFNYMEEGFEATGAPIYCVLIGMMVNLAGGLVRHFAANGFAGGSKTFDAKPARAPTRSPRARPTTGLRSRCDDSPPRAGEKKFDAAAFVGTCRDDTHLYEALPLLAVARNAVLSLDLCRRARRRRRRGAGCDTGVFTLIYHDGHKNGDLLHTSIGHPSLPVSSPNTPHILRVHTRCGAGNTCASEPRSSSS